MPEKTAFAYDVFISYRWLSPDQEWVREQLYPALINSGLRVCLDVEDFVPGRDLILEMERAGTESRHVLCIISPEYLAEGRMVGFESLLARRRDPDGINSTLIPFVLRETILPERIRGLIPINWTNPKDQDREWRKLLNVLNSKDRNIPRPGAIQLKEDSVTAESDRSRVEIDDEDLNEDDWIFLIRRIKSQSCTPIIGPGIYSNDLAFKSMAQSWSQNPDYPFTDLSNLTLAAQFRAVLWDSMDPKSEIITQVRELPTPDFNRLNEPHNILASFPLPYYITTNYDDFIFKALLFHSKQPRRDLCRWDDPQNSEELSIFKPGYEPNKDNPVVYHLYGYSEAIEEF
jgi:hypothetical protein